MNRSVWAVTYYDDGEEPVVTVFDNKEAAMACYSCFIGEHDVVNVDEAPVCHSFTVGIAR